MCGSFPKCFVYFPFLCRVVLSLKCKQINSPSDEREASRHLQKLHRNTFENWKIMITKFRRLVFSPRENVVTQRLWHKTTSQKYVYIILSYGKDEPNFALFSVNKMGVSEHIGPPSLLSGTNSN